MHGLGMQKMVQLSDTLDSAVARAVKAATRGSVVVASLLAKELASEGYLLVDIPMRVLHRVEVYVASADPETGEPIPALLVARGASSDPDDALLQAVYANLKEQAAAEA